MTSDPCNKGIRKIIHIDMDAFFAAVEQRDFPEYQGKPLIVGGQPDSRGVVATCNYEARKYGIHSAMPAAHAYRLCPQANFVKPRFEAYREASALIREIFNQYTALVEPLSLDEAYLDVTDACESTAFKGSATLLARHIKTEIKRCTQLTASAGISYNKFLAKIASDMDKPDGLYLIKPEEGENFVANLPVGRFHGIGKATERKMAKLGIVNGNDLKQLPLAILQQHFGKAGPYYYNIARGIDHRPVNNHRSSKSIGVETTYQQDILPVDVIMQQLQKLYIQAQGKAASKQFVARTLTVKIKYHDFTQITRSRTFSSPIPADTPVKQLLIELLKATEIGKRKVRLLGITLSALDKQTGQKQCRQIDLFE